MKIMVRSPRSGVAFGSHFLNQIDFSWSEFLVVTFVTFTFLLLGVTRVLGPGLLGD